MGGIRYDIITHGDEDEESDKEDDEGRETDHDGSN